METSPSPRTLILIAGVRWNRMRAVCFTSLNFGFSVVVVSPAPSLAQVPTLSLAQVALPSQALLLLDQARSFSSFFQSRLYEPLLWHSGLRYPQRSYSIMYVTLPSQALLLLNRAHPLLVLSPTQLHDPLPWHLVHRYHQDSSRNPR